MPVVPKHLQIRDCAELASPQAGVVGCELVFVFVPENWQYYFAWSLFLLFFELDCFCFSQRIPICKLLQVLEILKFPAYLDLREFFP